MPKSICSLMEEAERLAASLTAKNRSPQEAEKAFKEIIRKVEDAKRAVPAVDKQYLQNVHQQLKHFAAAGPVDQNGKRVPMEDIAAMMLDVANTGGVAGLTKFAKDAKRATTLDMLIEPWINWGLLSGPQTHAVNAISTGISTVWQIPERFFAASVGKVLPGETVSMREAMNMTYGFFEGMADGFKAFGHTMKTGGNYDLLSKMDVPVRAAISAKNLGVEDVPYLARAVDIFGSFVRMPTRLLAASDAGFKATNYRMELRARAVRQALAEGREGDDYARRVHEILNNPPKDIAGAAKFQADYATFTKELGEGGKKYMALVNSQPYLRLITPFVRTPINLVKYAGERTPLGLMSKAVLAELNAGGARRDLAIAKMSLGTAVMGIALKYAMENKITGGGPKDGRLRSIMRDEDWQPYSIKIGDKWVSYARIEPFSTLIGAAADYAEISGQMQDEDRSKLALAVILSGVKNITSKTFLKGISETVQAIDDPERYGESWVANYAKTLVPAAVAQVERLEDPELRSVYSHKGFLEEIFNAMKSRVPGWSDDLPVNRTLWGEPVMLGPGWGSDIATNLYRMVSPIYTTDIGDGEPINKELLRMEAGIGQPDRLQQIKGEPIQFTAQEYDDYIVKINTMPIEPFGKPMKEALNYLVTKDQGYKDLKTDDQKLAMIQSYINQGRKRALEMMYEEHPEIRKIIDKQAQMRYAQ